MVTTKQAGERAATASLGGPGGAEPALGKRNARNNPQPANPPLCDTQAKNARRRPLEDTGERRRLVDSAGLLLHSSA
eukprot:219656-Alexandrium_andersonii.AAC.1